MIGGNLVSQCVVPSGWGRNRLTRAGPTMREELFEINPKRPCAQEGRQGRLFWAV